ncbi:MAG TPA: PAS domain S-box protein [Anaerolineales bacterium]
MSIVKSQTLNTPRVFIPPWLTGRWGMAAIALSFYLLVFLAWTHFHWGGPEHISLIGNLAILPPMLLAVFMAWRLATQSALVRRLRWVWFILGLSFLTNFIGNVVWTYLENILHIEPFPSIADIFYLGSYPLMLWGLLTWPGMPQHRRERLVFWLDLIIVLTGASMFVGYFLIVPTATVNDSSLLAQFLATAYPIWSLVLLGGMLSILYRRPSPDTQAVFLLLLTGTAFFLASDFAFGYTSLAGTYKVGSWVDVGWNIAQLFFVLAALRQMHRGTVLAAKHTGVSLLDRLAYLLPFAATIFSYGLVLYVALTNFSATAEWLMAGALLLTLFVIARQIVSPAFADLPVRVKVILAFIMVSVLSVSLVSATAYLTIRSNLESLAGQTLKADVEIRSLTLGNELSKQLDLMEGFVLGETIENGARTANARYTSDQSAIEAQLQQQDRAWKAALDADPLVQHVLNNAITEELLELQYGFPTHTDLLLTDKHGAPIAATARPGDYSQAAEDWWQAAYNQGRGALYIGQPAFDPDTQSLRVIIAVPVHAHFRPDVIGVIRTTYNIQNIVKILTSSSHPETKGGFDLLLPGGQLLHPQGDVQSLEPDTMAHLQANQEADYAELRFEGTLQLVSQARVTSPDAEDAEALKNLNWTLIAHEEPALVFAPLHAAWRTALLTTLFVLFLTTGVAVILAQLLIAPISRLTRVVAQIAAGDLTTQARVESRDEIGTLAGTFNMMVQALSQTRQELQDSEALYRSLVDYLPDMIAVHSHERRTLFINPAGVKLMGAQSAEEILSRPIMDMVPPDARQEAERGMENTLAGEPTPLLQQKMHRLDGTSFEAEFRAIPISYAGQRAIQFVMRDITERKRAEEQIRQLLAQIGHQNDELESRVAQRTDELNALNQRLQDELTKRQQLLLSLGDSEARFRLLFEASPDAILLIDPSDPNISWPIVDCNEVACTMNGYTRQELIGQSIDILNAGPGNPLEREDYLERVREKGVLHYEAFHRNKAGQLFPVEVSTSLITFDGRELVLGIDRDITERKQTEMALQQAKEIAEAASRAKSEFLSRMSHELRTPMNAILGFAQLLNMSRKEPLTPIQKERVKQITKGGQHLLDLINEILDISRIEAGRLQISPEPVPLRESIQEVLDLTVPLAANRHIQLQASLDGNPFVMADRQRLKQVLLNLLSNAVKYNYDGGYVMVSCEQTHADSWRISVTDTGSGISSENLGRLFISFERLAADQSNVEGTGLGLALAKRLVELMHGRIGVESVVGQGSTFWIELPSAESQLERLQRTGGTGQLPVMSTTTRTILYVEDNIANFELIQQVLADYSQIELLWAADPQTGIEAARLHHPSLILLDLHLGSRDGADVLKQLKQDVETASIPVIMVSADATHSQIERLVALGAHSYLTKPLDVKLFMQLIEDLLSEKVN